MNKRIGDWMQTACGNQFWPLDPRPEEVDIGDIAHALSMLCRFGGHCTHFYSVAQHSVHVSELVAPEHRLWALLHDAAEAYLGDVVRPLKTSFTMAGIDFYKLAEKAVMIAVCEKFGLPSAEPLEVKYADQVMLATERRDLMVKKHPWMELPAPLLDAIVPQTSEEAKAQFMSAFRLYTM